jgi:hypothetical protein
MDRKMRKRLETENQRYPKYFIEIPENEWPPWPFESKKPVAIYRNRDFLVQKYQEDKIIRLSINRSIMQADGKWSDKIEWEELQNIKRALGYGDAYAIEIYPTDRDIVNVANMRHLWILPDPLPIGWFRK